MTALLTLTLVALALFAWVSITKIVPSYATSRYRYRLWRLRDDLSDDIRHGKFDQEEGPRKVLALIDLAIEDADDLSALNMILFAWTVVGTKDIPEDPLELGELSPHDDRMLAERLQAVHSALLAKTLLGSVSGWVITIVLTPFVFYSAMRDSGRPKILARASDRIQTDLLRSNQMESHHGRFYQHVG
ncbi:MAG TPA: hypothetical protein VFM51_04065 [Solirubrobacterales bacterium]|nr:hypothetical protein [Solirubrobacterales bacterium]